MDWCSCTGFLSREYSDFLRGEWRDDRDGGTKRRRDEVEEDDILASSLYLFVSSSLPPCSQVRTATSVGPPGEWLRRRAWSLAPEARPCRCRARRLDEWRLGRCRGRGRR